MKQPCDCCQGPSVLNPLATKNRPGLRQLSYRVGTHASFFETMQARLSSKDYPELAALRTREKTDASIALLDAWSTVGDVLTFYQERIANEGYLRTATERRSVLELARLVGYALRPGVASSVYLAYTLDNNAEAVEIPLGARVNSIPGPGEQMQAFETSEPLAARVEWNALKPRLTQPQTADSIRSRGLFLQGTETKLKVNDPLLVDLADGLGLQLVRVKKVEADHEHDRTHVVLRGLGGDGTLSTAHEARAVISRFRDIERFNVSPDSAMAHRTLAVLTDADAVAERDPERLTEYLETIALPALETELAIAREGRYARLEPWIAGLATEMRRVHAASATRMAAARKIDTSTGSTQAGFLGSLVDKLKIAPSRPPASARQLARDVKATFAPRADTLPRLLAAIVPALKKRFYAAWKNLPPPVAPRIRVYALRVTAAPFGHNAPLRQTGFDDTSNRAIFGEWAIGDPWNEPPAIPLHSLVSETGESIDQDHHEATRLFLDSEYDLAPDTLIALEKPDATRIIVTQAASLEQRSLAAYGLSGKSTLITLSDADAWLSEGDDFSAVRGTRVLAGSERLTPAEEPFEDDIGDSEIELDTLYEDLEPGRWLIVSGERTDIVDAVGEPLAGTDGTELVMLAQVEQRMRMLGDRVLPGDTLHTFITLAKGLAYRYKRDTVKVYGNVVKATHGETRQEVLGGGDAAKAFQQFTLKQPPLTHVSAPTVSGVESTLEVRVNDVEWHEVDSLAAVGPGDHRFVTRTDDEARTTAVFGNGEHGARLPTGQENVRASYRSGIGKPGNVQARQISLLNTRPLGVKEVINPLRASGGADKEGRDNARKNAPLAVMALDRLVSTSDYADLARTFGGVGKAAATRVTDGRRQVVQVTVAGADDIPIDTTSDLYRNLLAALHRYGDPYVPISLLVRERLALVISANVRIDPDYEWETLEPTIRSALLERFSFDNVDLGQDLLLADGITAVQGIRGVEYVDVDVFDTVSEDEVIEGFEASAAGNLRLEDRIPIASTELAYLAPDVPDTLILQEIKP